MRLTDFLQDIGRPVAYFPALKKIAGSTVATIFLTQFIYWTGKQHDPEGWIYKTQEEIEEETGLTRPEQETARRHLKRKELIEETYRGLPRRLFYRVNIAKINDLWSVNTAEALGDNNNAGIQHYCMRESSIQECGNPAIKNATIQQAIYTENTTEETTAKNTTTTTASVVFSFEEDEIKAAIAGTVLEGKINESVFQTLVADYNPQAHQAQQPETAVEGIKRLIRWTAAQMSNPESKPISNPIGFLRERAKKGMVKPAAVIRDEQEKEAERRNQEEKKRRRQELEKLRKEIDPAFLQEIRRITQS